mgnify:CR=1 FL=1
MYTLLGIHLKKWVEDVLKNEIAKRGIPIEAKKIGSKYYAYRSATVWDREKKKRRNVSVYIGRITQKGIDEGS